VKEPPMEARELLKEAETGKFALVPDLDPDGAG
jgi:hypothetical protein